MAAAPADAQHATTQASTAAHAAPSAPGAGNGGNGGGAPRAVGDPMSTRVDVINTDAGRILCVADVRGNLSSLNVLAAEHSAVAIIHSGDFGFYETSSLASISDRTLKHLVQYSPLIPAPFRSQLLSPNTSPGQMRDLLANPPRSAFPDDSSETAPFGLSEFPRLLTGELKLSVPVYAVWGACEDVAVLEKIRLAPASLQSVPSDPSKVVPVPPSTATRPSSIPSTPHSYSIPNLTVLDEATTRVLLIGGVRLRLFGLGGAVVQHKLFDNGAGTATIAGGQGTMWSTMLQIGELVDTAQKVYDPSETRLLISHASPGREGLLAQLALVLKADLTVSAGLHFRYGVSYNEFSVQHDPDAYRNKLEAARKSFNEIWDAVKGQVEGVVDESQRTLLQNALAVANRVPATNFVGGAANVEEAAWKNCWNWNLPDASFGSLILDIREGRIGSEMKSQGFNFAYRQNAPRPPAAAATSAPASSQPPAPASASNPHFASPTPAPPPASNRPAAPTGPSPAPSTTPAVPPAYAQRPFGNNGANGPAHPHSRPTPIGNHPHQRGPGGGRGGGRGGFGAPGSALNTPAPATAAAAGAAPSGPGNAAKQEKEDSAAAPGQGQQAPAAANGDAAQTPAPQQRSQSGRGQRGQNAHQRQQQQQQQQQAANASGDSNATGTDSAKKPDSAANTAGAAATAAPDAGSTTGAESSANESGPLSPATPGPEGARGGRGGRGRGRGGNRGRSNGEWTRGAGGGGRSGRGGGGDKGNAGGEGASTPGGGGAEGKKNGGGGGNGGEGASA